MENWQDATSQQVKLLTRRLNELLSNGLDLLHSELGVDLGLKPELIPPWVILLAACIGLVLMVALWASTCRRFFKKRSIVTAVDDGIEIKPIVTKPMVKSEEQKKKKKRAEKKAQAAQPNGRAAAEPHEEIIVSEEIVPHHQPPLPEVKNEKVSEVKKAKKKAKQVVKETKAVVTESKEPEEGTWETKVSNKEKREQRKKDKTPSDGSASPGGGDAQSSAAPEPAKASAAQAPAPQAPAPPKKKKGESSKPKTDKFEAQANSSEVVAPVAIASGASTDMNAVDPPHAIGQEPGQWTAKQEPGSLWGAEIDGSWTVIESRVGKTSDLNLMSFTGLGVCAEAQPAPEMPWAGQPRVEDEWSGMNNASADPGSDWNAPSEAWGNYEEPQAPQPPPPIEEVQPEPAKEEEEEEDKAETPADGAAKAKKKKKKKKKAAEEGGATGQEGEEPEKEVGLEAPGRRQQFIQEAVPAAQPVKAAVLEASAETSSKKAPVTQVPPKPSDAVPAGKHSNLQAAALQKKAEESQAPKPAKKKKARRET